MRGLGNGPSLPGAEMSSYQLIHVIKKNHYQDDQSTVIAVDNTFSSADK